MHKTLSRFGTAVLSGLIVAAVVMLLGATPYGIAIVALLAVKLALSGAGRTPAEPGHEPIGLRIGVAVPVHNEDVATLRGCLLSLIAQERRPDSVTVVDDGSTTLDAYEEASSWTGRFAEAGIPLLVVRFPENRGKRAALAEALDRQDGIDVLMCVDSDSALSPAAIGEGLRAFGDPRVMAVSGVILVANRRRNLLTRLMDLRYANSFFFERAAYSRLGAVLCVCGSLAFYRTSLFAKYRHDFLNQTFLGQPATFGDDRRLTNYALLEGRVVMQPTAIGWTVVPERLGHYVRQQIRWTKSFLRESLWALRHLPPKRAAFWLTYLELGTWLVFTMAVPFVLLVAPMLTGKVIILTYLLCVTSLSYARSVRYFRVVHPGQRTAGRIGTFLLAPVYALLQLALILLVRPYAVLTLGSARWGTRRVVEIATVRSAPLPEPEPAPGVEYQASVR